MSRSERAIAPASSVQAASAFRIGFGWGVVFALPVLAFALVPLGERIAYGTYIAEAAFLYAMPVALTLAGAWWARRDVGRRRWRHVLLAALALGFALILIIVAAILLHSPEPLKMLGVSDAVKAFLFLWALASAWVAALCSVISLHLFWAGGTAAPSRPEARSEVASETVGQSERREDSLRGRHFVFALAAAIAVPLLLSVPVIALLRYDTRQHVNANTILAEAIGRIKAQIGDLRDYESVKANLLTREQILKVLDPSAAQTSDLLSVVGALPGDLALWSFEAKGRRISLVLNRPTYADERSLVELLKRSGFRDVALERTAAQKEGEVEFATVTAASTRGDTR